MAADDLLAALRRWQQLQFERGAIDAEMGEVARELERRAAALNRDGPYARLVGQDRDGRLRFEVRGGGTRAFTLAQLVECDGA